MGLGESCEGRDVLVAYCHEDLLLRVLLTLLYILVDEKISLEDIIVNCWEFFFWLKIRDQELLGFCWWLSLWLLLLIHVEKGGDLLQDFLYLHHGHVERFLLLLFCVIIVWIES